MEASSRFPGDECHVGNLLLGKMAMKNGDLPIENGDLPIENGDLPIENGDLPIEHGDFPSFFVCLPEGNITIAIELQRLYNLVGG